MSRFRSLTRWQAGALLALLAGLIGFFALVPPPAPPLAATKPNASLPAAAKRDPDLHLYRTINARVREGMPYYEAAVLEQRSQGYPLRPFITMRPPTLAWLAAFAGPMGMLALLWILGAATVFSWWQRLEGVFLEDPGRRVTGTMLVAAGAAIVAQPQYAVLHELWAGLLIASAIALHRPGRWWLSLVLATLAVLIRELSLPFLLLMGAFAVWQRRWVESLGWVVGVVVFGLALTAHAHQVAVVVSANDPASPGWGGFHGLNGWLRTITEASALHALPGFMATSLAILALFGWISWRSRTGLIGCCFLFGYGVFFSILGRPESFYWGLIVTPVLLLGLAFLPAAFSDLKRATAGARPKLDMLPR